MRNSFFQRQQVGVEKQPRDVQSVSQLACDKIGPLVCQSARNSGSRSVCQSDSKTVSQSFSQSVGRSVGRSVSQSVSRSAGRSVGQSFGGLVGVGWLVSGTIIQSVRHPVNRSVGGQIKRQRDTKKVKVTSDIETSRATDREIVSDGTPKNHLIAWESQINHLTWKVRKVFVVGPLISYPRY